MTAILWLVAALVLCGGGLLAFAGAMGAAVEEVAGDA